MRLPEGYKFVILSGEIIKYKWTQECTSAQASVRQGKMSHKNWSRKEARPKI
jgi:hypothetical protein